VRVLGLVLVAPVGADVADVPFPALIFLHGCGGTGRRVLSQTRRVPLLGA